MSAALHVHGTARTKLLRSRNDIIDPTTQPNAVDLPAATVYEIKNAAVMFDEDGTRHVTTSKIPVMPSPETGRITLQGGKFYEIFTGWDVEIASGELGYCVGRSTFTRNGAIFTGGIYDSGFKGPVAFCVYVHPAAEFQIVPRRTFMVQFIILSSETIAQYDGYYQLLTEKQLQQERAA